MTILEDTRVITGGVDTHADMHVAAALDPLGGPPGVREFPATAAGYADLLSGLTRFGDLALVGVEGTGSYGGGPGPVPGRGRRPGRGGRSRGPPGPPPPGQI